MSDESNPTPNTAEHQSIQLNYAPRRPEPKLVVLGKFPSMEAELVRIRLNNEGIRATVGDQASAALYQGIIGSVGAAKVLVFDDELDRAREILSRRVSLDEDDLDEDDGYVEETWRCPKCHSKQIGVHPMKTWELLICLGTLWFASVFIKRTRQCTACGHSWTG